MTDTSAQAKKDWGPTNLLGTQVSGKTLGIIGGGRVGMAVGHRAKGFNMNILYYDVATNPTFEKTTGSKLVEKKVLLTEADFISIHVPLLATTRHLIGSDELSL